MRSLVVGWGAVVAFGCGGIAIEPERQLDERGPKATPGDNQVITTPTTPGLAQGGGASGPSSYPRGGSALGGEPSINVGGEPSIDAGGEPSIDAGGEPNIDAGGAPTVTGAAGEGNQSSCESPVTQELSPFDKALPEDAPVGQQLASASKKLIGHWHGVVTTPWVPPYAVVASFGADGSYSAHCEQNSDFHAGGQGCCRALYYGSDRDSSLKQWLLSSVNSDGSVEGDLDVAFCYDGEKCYLPSWQGKLGRLQFDQAANRMRFQFRRDDGYGPVQFDLERD